MNCMNRSVNYGSECTVAGLLVIGAELIESLQFAEACSMLVVVNKQQLGDLKLLTSSTTNKAEQTRKLKIEQNVKLMGLILTKYSKRVSR